MEGHRHHFRSIDGRVAQRCFGSGRLDDVLSHRRAPRLRDDDGDACGEAGVEKLASRPLNCIIACYFRREHAAILFVLNRGQTDLWETARATRARALIAQPVPSTHP